MRKKWARAITSRLSVMALLDLFQELDVMRGQAMRSCALPQQCEIAKRGGAVVIMAAGHGSCGLKPYSEGIHRRQQSARHCGGSKPVAAVPVQNPGRNRQHGVARDFRDRRRGRVRSLFGSS